MDWRREKLAGSVPVGTEVSRRLGSWWRTSGGVAVSAAMLFGLIAFLGKQDKSWIGEVWVNAAMEGEELLNGLLILAGAAVVDESEWMSCPNQLALQAAVELAGLESSWR